MNGIPLILTLSYTDTELLLEALDDALFFRGHENDEVDRDEEDIAKCNLYKPLQASILKQLNG